MKDKGRFRLLTITIITLIPCIAALSAVFLPNSTVRAAAPGGLHVVGNQIEDGSNHVVVPHGVDRMGGEYACISSGGASFDGPVDQTTVNAMLSWDITIVRVPLNEDCWLGINGEPADGTTAAQYQQDVVNWVKLLNQNNLIVILDLHWNNSGTNKATGQEPMPDLDHAPAFWTSVANTFKSDSSVIFDLYNEPYPGFNNATTTGWSCWKNGSTAASTSPCADVAFAVAGMQTLVNTVRATGATNVIMLGGLAYSNDLSGWLANEPTDPQNNLVASVHIYNFNTCASSSCWDSQVAPVAAKVPVIAGEIGENDCASGFISTLMSWFDQHSIGYLAWSWSPYDCSQTPALISDYTGAPTNYGAGFKSHLLALAGSGGVTPTPTPTQGMTPTPTPSAGSCSVHYVVQNQWSGGFTANITLNNTSSSALNGWVVKFTFPATQAITQGWSASFSQQGEQVTAQNLSYNGSIAAGNSTSFGFNGSWSGSNPSPTSFTLNSATCSVV